MNTPLDDMFKKFSDTLPEPLRKIQADVEQNSREMLENMLQKMNLVTREEFEIQTAVLQRTREKLEVLEQQVTILEQRTRAETDAQPQPDNKPE